MLNIRRLGLFDKPKIKKILKRNGIDVDFKYPFLKELFCLTQSFVPLKYKFMSETFVCTDGKELKGAISVRPVRGNSKTINILQLIFANNDYLTGKELVNFVVEYFGKSGVTTFKVVIDDNQKDLESLFVNSCGFRCGSWENLWDVTKDIEKFKEYNTTNYSMMSDGYTKQVAELINSELLSHYKPALERYSEEFKSPILEVFQNNRSNSFIKKLNRRVCAYLNIQTLDNKNFVVIPYKNSGYEISFDEMISFAVKNITEFRQSQFNLYVCQQKNLKFSAELEDFMHSKNYECVNTRHILIKEFYKPIKQEYQSFIFAENGLLVNR